MLKSGTGTRPDLSMEPIWMMNLLLILIRFVFGPHFGNRSMRAQPVHTHRRRVAGDWQFNYLWNSWLGWLRFRPLRWLDPPATLACGERRRGTRRSGKSDGPGSDTSRTEIPDSQKPRA